MNEMYTMDEILGAMAMAGVNYKMFKKAKLFDEGEDEIEFLALTVAMMLKENIDDVRKYVKEAREELEMED
jgi:hypothetical protein